MVVHTDGFVQIVTYYYCSVFAIEVPTPSSATSLFFKLFTLGLILMLHESLAVLLTTHDDKLVSLIMLVTLKLAKLVQLPAYYDFTTLTVSIQNCKISTQSTGQLNPIIGVTPGDSLTLLVAYPICSLILLPACCELLPCKILGFYPIICRTVVPYCCSNAQRVTYPIAVHTDGELSILVLYFARSSLVGCICDWMVSENNLQG